MDAVQERTGQRVRVIPAGENLCLEALSLPLSSGLQCL